MPSRWRRLLLVGVGLTSLAEVVAPMATSADGPYPWPLPPQYAVVDLPVSFPVPMSMPDSSSDPTQPIWPITDALTQLISGLGSTCGGCPSAGSVPTVTVAIQGSRSTFSRGEAVGFTVTVTNTTHQRTTVNSLTNPVPAGFAAMPAAAVSLNGAPCNAGTTPACTVSGGSLNVSSFTLDNLGQAVFGFAMVATGGDRGCFQTQDQAHIVTGAGTATGTSGVATLCDGGLGQEPWWSYTPVAIGPEGGAAMNAGDGNLVLSQDDSTAIPGHGRLTLRIHRVYNSEDTGNAPAPNAFGSGWGIDFEDWESSPAGVQNVAALYVPPAESVSAAHPVTVVDDGGSRQVVALAMLPTPINVGSLSSSSALGTLLPRVLSLDTAHYTNLCVDAAATGGAPGVHLGMWRYTEVNAASQSTPCTPATGTTAVVLGFAAERPDRIRDEFSWDGHKLDAVDGNGNEVRYTYASAPAAGAALGQLQRVAEVASGRAVTLSYLSGETDITDAAQRVTKYTYSGSSLTGVLNPDGSRLTYSYGGCTGATALQLCATQDARGVTATPQYSTTFGYTTAWSDGTAVVGPSKLARISDRSGATSQITHVPSPDSVTVDLGIERTQYALFDAAGSAGEIDGIDRTTPSSPKTLHTTLLSWDTASGASTCRQPDAAVDHNLCRSFRKVFNTTATAEDTAYVYSPAGAVAIERQCLASADSASAAPCPASTANAITSRDSTTGFHSQYVEAGGTVSTYDDTVTGGGAVTTPGPSSGGPRWDAQTLFALYDQTSALSGRGNQPGLNSSQVATYLTTETVDDSSSANPNSGVAAGTCNGNSGNTGNVCREQLPTTGTSVAPVYRYTYVAHGELASAQTPVNDAAGRPATTYTYYADSDHDLSGTTSAGGWLKATTTPLGDATVDAYDAAGNLTRSWEPNVVAPLGVAAFPGSISAPTSTQYSEVLHGPGAGSLTSAYSAPWRSVLSRRDPLGNTTTYTVDLNGNQTVVRSPRGSAANSSADDITQTFDVRDQLLTRSMPVERASGGGQYSYSYDAFGNRTRETDPRGVVTVFVFDAVNRQVKTLFTRGPWSTDSNNPSPSSCVQSTSANSPIPAGRAMCTRTVAYDGADNPTALGDASGQVTTVTYDGLHREVSRLVPRFDGTNTTLRTDRVYDLDGNVVSLCSPRAFTEGNAPTCTSAAAQPYRRDRTYDTRNHQLTESTMHAAGGSVNTTSYAYDADGNQITVTTPNGHPRSVGYDADDRRISESWQRVAGGPTISKTWAYDHSGNVTSESDGTSRIGYAYDAADRRTDTVAGWDGSTAILTAVASADGGTNAHTRTVYDADGNVVGEYDARAFSANGASMAYETTKTYDNDDRVSYVYTPRYDGGGASDQSVNSATQTTECPTGVAGYPAGVGVCTTHYTYDGDNNTATEYLPTSGANRWIQYTYTDDNLLLVESTPSPAQDGAHVNDTTYLYDANGKAVKVTDALGRPTVTTYSADELVLSVNDEPNGPTSHLIRYAYDGNNNRTRLTDANGRTTTSVFTSDDLLSSTTDADGGKTSYTYDAAGNPVQVVSPDANARTTNNLTGAPTTNTYTFDNLLASSTQPVSADGTSQLRRTTYTYADFGGKATQDVQLVNSSGSVLSDAGTMTFTYYPDQRLQTQYGRNNQLAIVHRYDAAGHLTSVAQGAGATPGQPLPAPTNTVSATYYLDGRLRSATDQVSQAAGGAANATTSYGYDGEGTETSRNQVLSNGHQYTTTYTLNDAGKVASMSASPPNATWRWTYDAGGQVSSESLPNNLWVTYTYAPDGTINVRNLAQQNSFSPDAQWAYLYDGTGRITEEDLHGFDATNKAVAVYRRYQYTAAGRLSDFNWSDGTTSKDEPVSWDPDGNRLSFNGSSWTYNADDSLATTTSSGTTRSDTYNAAGDMTGDGCIGFAYDSFDRLASSSGTRAANCPRADSTVNSYDGLDRKIAHNDGPFGELSGEHYDGLNTTLLTDQHLWSNNPEVVYVLDPSDHVAADVFWPQGFNHTEYLSDDGYDNSDTVVNTTGAVSCDSVTDPFGSPLYNQYGANSCHTGSTQSSVTFKSGLHDNGNRTTKFGRRDYRADEARFLERDDYREITDPRMARAMVTHTAWTQRWAFTKGDPVNFSDPSGHNPCRDEEGDGGCTQEERIDQEVTQKGGVAPTVKRWIKVERAGRKARNHLFDVNAQRTMNIGGGTDFGISIDLMTGLCYTCNGTREHDGRTYGFSQKMGTWDCSPATKGASCDESHTYRWSGRKVQEYDDGVRTIGGLVADAGHWIWDHKVDIGLLALNFVPGAGEVADAVMLARVAEVGEEAVNAARTVEEAASVVNEAEKAGSVAEEVGQAAEEGSQAATKAESCLVNSFTGDTPVVMADGTSKPIRALKPGDRVRTTDPSTGKLTSAVVSRTYLNDDTNLIDLTVRDTHGSVSTLHTTQHHRFWESTRHGWVNAVDLAIGGELKTADGSHVVVAALRSWVASAWMYDITVDGTHTFYVDAGSTPVLVHNCNTMIGENGTQTASKTMWQGKAGRIDVENPAPGVRPGQIHFQDWAGRKAMYNFENGAFFHLDGSVSKTAMDLLYDHPGFQNGVTKALALLGELK